MKLKNSILAGCTALVVATSCTQRAVEKQTWVEKAIENAHAQIGLEIDTIESSGRFLNPVTLNNKGGVYYCGYADWRSGFFPGSVWYLYELTGDTALLPLAQKYTEAISEAQNLTWHHDIGFIINCSFGNGLRLIDKPGYKEVMIQAAKSLCTRFREKPQVIQSWDVKGNSWQSERGWECPVIIDNMMNLELLFEATKLSGDSTFYNVAVMHADRTLKEQFRPDGAVITLLITVLRTEPYVIARLLKAIPMNLFGLEDKHGRSMDIPYVIEKQRIVLTLTRQSRLSNL